MIERPVTSQRSSSGLRWAEVVDLTREECLRHLAATHLGRVAISVGALPAILPVRFLLDGDDIVFRAAPGKVLEAATRGAVVAFEVDGAERACEPDALWSVLVIGMARHLAPADARDHEGAAALPSWSDDRGDSPRDRPADGPRDSVVSISSQLMSGRRAVLR